MPIMALSLTAALYVWYLEWHKNHSWKTGLKRFKVFK